MQKMKYKPYYPLFSHDTLNLLLVQSQIWAGKMKSKFFKKKNEKQIPVGWEA